MWDGGQEIRILQGEEMQRSRRQSIARREHDRGQKRILLGEKIFGNRRDRTARREDDKGTEKIEKY